MKLESQRLSDPIGVEIFGLNPTKPIDEKTIQDIRRLWLDNNILLFRNIDWTPEQQISFTKNFGKLHIMPQLSSVLPPNLATHPEIFIVSNIKKNGKPIGFKAAGWGWHSDGEDKHIPNMGSMLYAVDVPNKGGDTGFANTYKSCEALPQEIKKNIVGKRARFSRITMHSINYPSLPPLTRKEKLERPDVWHPIIRTHPETNRECLFIGRWAVEIEGMPANEGRDVIKELTAFTTKDDFIYIHKWKIGDVILWDNRCTQHCAVPYDGEEGMRYLLRTTLEGDLPYYKNKGGKQVCSYLA